MPTVTKEPVAFDPWKTPKETWQYITIPDEDPTGLPFPTIRLNKDAYEKGQTYQVPKAIAATVTERVKAFNKSVVRLFSPQVDRKALEQVAVGTAMPVPSQLVDAANIKTL